MGKWTGIICSVGVGVGEGRTINALAVLAELIPAEANAPLRVTSLKCVLSFANYGQASCFNGNGN